MEKQLKPNALLDIYISDHVNALNNLIRDKLTLELVSCFSSVKIKHVEEQLGIKDIKTHLEKMFYNNDLEVIYKKITLVH